MRARIQAGGCTARITYPTTARAIGAVAHVQKMVEDRKGSIHSALNVRSGPEERVLSDESDVLGRTRSGAPQHSSANQQKACDCQSDTDFLLHASQPPFQEDSLACAKRWNRYFLFD